MPIESIMSMESRNKDDATTQGNDASSAVPSGFILKLYQMVNGAPDEVISVSLRFQQLVLWKEKVEASAAPMSENLVLLPPLRKRMFGMLCESWVT